MLPPNLPDTSKEAIPDTPSGSHSSSPPDYVSVAKDNPKEKSDSDLVSEEEQSPSGWVKAFFGKRRDAPRDPDATATRRSVFDDPHLAPFYTPKNDHENIHRFDPSARWTYREEKALLRKVDWKVMTTVAVCFLALYLEHNTIIQANSTDFLSDLHLTTDDYNLGNTLLRLSHLVADLPSQLISKRVGPDRCVPAQICLWSIISLSQFWLTGRTPFLVFRVLLGLLQGGLVPNMILYMSYFYTKTELPVRLAGGGVFLSLSSIVSTFLAYGILHLDGVSGKAGWRWLFLIQGLITFVTGVVLFFSMRPSPTQTKAWFQPKGWFTEREEVIIVNKVLRDDPTKGDMHNREGLSLKGLWSAICDYDMWPLYILGFTSGIPTIPPENYITLLLRQVGFNTFDTNILTIPNRVIAMITVVSAVLTSELVNERTFMAMMHNLWALPFLAALYTLPQKPNPWIIFGLLTGLLGSPPAHPIQAGWGSRNSGAVANRATNASLYNMCALASGIVASQLYVASDAPRYNRGNRILITMCSVNILLLYPGTKLYYIWRNRQRGKIWNGMTSEEKANYLETTKDVGNKRLDFRFAH